MTMKDRTGSEKTGLDARQPGFFQSLAGLHTGNNKCLNSSYVLVCVYVSICDIETIDYHITFQAAKSKK